MYQLITEEVNVSKLRDVSIDDLLGRDAIQIDLDSVVSHLTDKTILVTGEVVPSEVSFAGRLQSIIPVD